MGSLAALLKERGFRPKRALGQNFLVDDNFLDALVRDAGIREGDRVVEIGAGPGDLTARLCDVAKQVWAFEIDPEIHAIAVERLGPRPNLALILGDGASFDEQIAPGVPVIVVSNLPYADWERILLRILSARREVVSCVLMLQRDVVDRLRARPGTKDYGPLPALIQAACEIKILRRAPKELFYPVPRVDSVVFRLRRRVAPMNFEEAARRLRALFAHRRKKSAAAGGRRVEDLDPAELMSLCREGKEKP